MKYINLIGFIAGTLTSASFLPQLIRALRTKSLGDVSWGMLLILASGIFLWMVYGILIGAFPVIFSNFASFILVASIIILKKTYR